MLRAGTEQPRHTALTLPSGEPIGRCRGLLIGYRSARSLDEKCSESSRGAHATSIAAGRAPSGWTQTLWILTMDF
jgi:hypothetical protein